MLGHDVKIGKMNSPWLKKTLDNGIVNSSGTHLLKRSLSVLSDEGRYGGWYELMHVDWLHLC